MNLTGTFNPLQQTGAAVMQQGQATGDLDFYMQLGQQMLERQMAMMQMQEQQMAMADQGMAQNNLALGDTGTLTGGFDPNWLQQRLAAGSANGQAIG